MGGGDLAWMWVVGVAWILFVLPWMLAWSIVFPLRGKSLVMRGKGTASHPTWE